MLFALHYDGLGSGELSQMIAELEGSECSDENDEEKIGLDGLRERRRTCKKFI